MKKLSKLKLHNVAILNDQEMKCITGGYDDDVTYTYWFNCECKDPKPPLRYDATDSFIASGKNTEDALKDAGSRCGGFARYACTFDKVTAK